MTCPNLTRNECLGRLRAVLKTVRDGLVVCVVQLDAGEVAKWRVFEDLTLEQWDRLMSERPKGAK
jgi:hypothetical protein